jgi:hypothetical protein
MPTQADIAIPDYPDNSTVDRERSDDEQRIALLVESIATIQRGIYPNASPYLRRSLAKIISAKLAEIRAIDIAHSRLDSDS